MTQEDRLQFMLGQITTKLEIIHQELKEQKVEVEKLKYKVHRWSGALAVGLLVWAAVSDKILQSIGLKG